MHVLQKCKLFCILLQNCYFLINLMKKLGNFLASDNGTLMSPSTADNSNCWWCWSMLYPIKDLQCIRLWNLLMIIMVLNCILYNYVGYWHNLFFLDKTSSELELCMDLHTLFVWVLLTDLQYCYYVYSIFFKLATLYYTL